MGGAVGEAPSADIVRDASVPRPADGGLPAEVSMPAEHEIEAARAHRRSLAAMGDRAARPLFEIAMMSADRPRSFGCWKMVMAGDDPTTPGAIITGRVAALRGYDQPVEIEEYEVPDPEPGGLILAMRQATICGSDLHVWRGETRAERAPPAAFGFGHEGFGVVHALGEGTNSDSAGKPLRSGSRHPSHIDGPHRRRVAAPPRVRKATVLHDDLRRLLLRRCAPSGSSKCPTNWPTTRYPPSTCAMGTSINAVIEAGTTFGSAVEVFGAGSLGLTAAAAAKDMGATTVIVLDRIPARLQLARRFGADHTITRR